MIRRNCKKLKHKPLCWAPENSWNVLFLPKSVVSLRLPLTWQVFGSTTPRLMARSFFSMQIFFPSPSRSHSVELIVIFLLLFFSPLSQKLTVTQLELCEAKNGTAAFFKWHKFVSLYLDHMSPAWEQRGGGQLWRNDLVWIKTVSQQAPQGLILSPACLGESLPHYRNHIMLHQLPPRPLVFLFLAVKCSETQ